jgi:hypothetical protein
MSSHDEPTRHEYTASLRVWSETLGLAELTDQLGEPSKGHDVGDPISSRRPDSGRRKHAMWMLESGLDRTRPLDEHIEALLEAVEAQSEAFEAIREKSRIDVFCGPFSGDGAQGGFTLEPQLSARLAALSLPVGFDVY